MHIQLKGGVDRIAWHTWVAWVAWVARGRMAAWPHGRMAAWPHGRRGRGRGTVPAMLQTTSHSLPVHTR